MSDDEDSPLAKRYKSETTSDLEISPVLTDSYHDKSVNRIYISNKKKNKKIFFYF